MITPTGEVRRVSDALLSGIVGGSYPSGLRLPTEASLAEQFECGRSTVREALRHLADLGLVRSRRGSGATVLDFRREGTPALLPTYLRVGRFDAPPDVMARELLRMRTLMATEAARMAARYAPVEALAEARELLARAPGLEDDPAAHALNELEFHRALVVASGIWPATWMVNAFWMPLREINAQIAPLLGPIQPDFQPTMEHLLELIEQRDERAAVAQVAAWFERIDGPLLAVIAELLGGSR